jgi:diguanylate cyclase (GGDEF)-like protein
MIEALPPMPGPDGDAQRWLGRRPRLLIVDDQPANVQVLHQVFAQDHQVFMATSGEQALAVCAAKLPDLVLLDVVMPGMDGYEVCARLKADAATRDIPVIFVSANDDERSEAHGLDVGAVDYIGKPINPKIVRARVRTHLTLKHQADLLRQWVYIDGLTNVCNRRRFDERLVVEWARAVRQGSALSVAMIDVDQFKRFNDRYGHQAGDACLRRVADELKGHLKRPADLLARYGGEEFVCLLPDTELAGAMEFARQLAGRVRHAGIVHEASDVAPVVTVSIGIATKPAGTVGSGAALLREADAQLYIAKSRGRDQVCGGELDGP